MERVRTGSMGISASILRNSSSMPSPVSADTRIGAPSPALAAPVAIASRSSGLRRSILFSTRNRGRFTTLSSHKIFSTSWSSSW